jgi:cyclase
VSRHCWAFIGQGDDVYDSFGANTGLIIGKEACLVVDTGFHLRTANQLLSVARSHPHRQLYVLNTHYHSDHVFGNSPFVEADATVIAHANCRQSMLSQSEKLLDKYRNRNKRLAGLLRKVQVRYPSLTFQKNLTLHLDGETTVDIVHPVAVAHTNGDSVAVCREDGVVFAGDIFWNKYHPNLEDARIGGQIQALQWILKAKPRKIIPGHGRVANSEDVKTAIRYLRELEGNIRTIRSGKKAATNLIPSSARNWQMRWLMDEYLHGLG